jgi:transcriptional regulator with PAS, ATPase and Fis domain
MFGYKKGAFTGAVDSRAGWFEMADNGTVFLDEISEMNLNLQAKLLRVLEDKKVRRLGSEKETEINVRIISASNQNFDDVLKQNKFRPDLYYRLAVFVIHLLPLRERKDDIPQLVEYYIKYFSAKMNKKILHINKDIFDILKNYVFTGNIRELRNICERAVILCNSDSINEKHFDTISKQCSSINCEEIFDLELNEKNLILKALEKSGNNKSVAAKLLNITWQSLDRRLIKFNIM